MINRSLSNAASRVSDSVSSRSKLVLIGFLLLYSCNSLSPVQRQQERNRQAVIHTPGLVAFWDFVHRDQQGWSSYYDPATINRSFPVFLRRIGDEADYAPETWPYEDADSKLMTDPGGPFGNAVRFNKGYIYGAVPRAAFDGSLLDLHGQQPFSLLAWVKFTGVRHLVTGIWDEGGWQKYAGRRQVALFGGLFGQKGVIAHISATGASSYPQSEINGSQYARVRAIDGQAFENNEWVMMAMTYDPERQEVKAYLNGVMTPLAVTDPVAQDVYKYTEAQPANPFHFEGPVFSPLSFQLKYNGYQLPENGIHEHRLQVDLKDKKLTYRRDGTPVDPALTYRVRFDVQRRGSSLLQAPLVFDAKDGYAVDIPLDIPVAPEDVVYTSLEVLEGGYWRQIGSRIERKITAGAPFTFGRALGLAAEEIEHGSQLYLSGVAVFSRVLRPEEMRRLSFKDQVL